MVASTAAPPAMSVFISRMPALGLIEIPPVSKVIPLPTRTGCADPAVGCRYLATTTRGGVAEPLPTARTPPNPPARSSSGPRTVTVTCARPPSRSTAWSASQAGFFTLLGLLTRSRAQATDSADTRPASAAATTAGAAASAATTGTVVSRGGGGGGDGGARGGPGGVRRGPPADPVAGQRGCRGGGAHLGGPGRRGGVVARQDETPAPVRGRVLPPPYRGGDVAAQIRQGALPHA